MNIKSLKIISESEVKNNFKFEKYLIESLKDKKFKMNEKLDISNFFVKDIKFMKSTGVHIPEGIILHGNVKSFNNLKKIENHNLFNLIRNHFIPK